MTQYQTNRFTMAVPDSWVDRSMFSWVAPPSPEYKVLPNVLCSAGDLQTGEDLGRFVNRQLKELMAQVRNFDLISRQDTLLGGVPAVELLFRMRPQTVMLQQRQLFFRIDPDLDKVNTMVFTAAADDFDKLASVFSEIMNSVSWNS